MNGVDSKGKTIDASHPDFYKRHLAIHGDTSNQDFEDINSAYRNAIPKGTELVRIKKIVTHLDQQNLSTPAQLLKGMAKCRRLFKGEGFKKSQLLNVYHTMVENNEITESMLGNLLVKKQLKTQSGVLVVTVVTSPYPKIGDKTQKFTCKWNCYYCPNEPGQPRSYLHDEPSVLRANRNHFDAILQFHDRVSQLMNNGHPVDKVELLVLGGTWSSYPHEYQETFIRDIFYAANTFFERKNNVPDLRDPLCLEEEKLINEKTKVKIIGITLETRPDCIDADEIKRFRRYGCTRVQLGVQHTNDNVLNYINRECTSLQVKQALELLRNCCYKMDIHLMPNLPGSTPDMDNKMFDEILTSDDFHADQWKIYPTEITPWTVIKKWYEEGKFIPYSGDELEKVIIRVKSKIHPWIRLNRMIRDIPSQYVVGPIDDSNLREVITRKMHIMGLKCKCIRCREVRNDRDSLEEPEMVIRQYRAGKGIEYFISFETSDRSRIMGFVRLRICDDKETPGAGIYPSLVGCGLIRELHVYGQMKATYSVKNLKVKDIVQHKGFGSQLMRQAENIAKQHGYNKMAVISGVGVRDFYRKIGYVLDEESEMMVKDIDNNLTVMLRQFSFIAAIMILISGLFVQFCNSALGM